MAQRELGGYSLKNIFFRASAQCTCILYNQHAQFVMRTPSLIFPLKSVRLLAICILFSFHSNAQISKLVGGVLTKKSDDVKNMSVTFGYTTNLYSLEAKTLTQNAIKGWKEGASMVGAVFTKRDGIGLIEMDGKVFVDGIEAEYIGLGSFILILENDDLKPKTIRVEVSNGVSYEVVVEPAPEVKIKSINSSSSGTAIIDLSSDLNLELDFDKSLHDLNVALGLITGVPGGKDFSAFCIAKPKEKLQIPYQAVTSKQISAGGISGKTNLIKFKKG